MTLPDEAINARLLEFVQSFQTRVQAAVDVARLCQLKLIVLLHQVHYFSNALAVSDLAYLSSEVTPWPTPGDWTSISNVRDGSFSVLAVSASTATLELPKHW